MYIAGSFHTVSRALCGGGKGWLDNDPHFWTQPPTWGICRNDLRKKSEPGDYVFFVLPRPSKHPQCLFGYIKIAEKITHIEAYRRLDLRSKRMGNKSPNGNIIVTNTGTYNHFDANAHRHMFNRIKCEYVISDPHDSKILTVSDIERLSSSFIGLLQAIFGGYGTRSIDYISRYGKLLNEQQVNTVLGWVNS